MKASNNKNISGKYKDDNSQYHHSNESGIKTINKKKHLLKY